MMGAQDKVQVGIPCPRQAGCADGVGDVLEDDDVVVLFVSADGVKG
jgi:hypothetical protein